VSNVVATVTGDCTNDVPAQRAASAAAAAAAAAVADAARMLMLCSSCYTDGCFGPSRRTCDSNCVATHCSRRLQRRPDILLIMAVEMCACAVRRPRFQTGFRKRRRQRDSLCVSGCCQVVAAEDAVDGSSARQRKESGQHGRRRRRMLER